MTRAELKQKAKDSLKGKYGQAILVLIIFGALTGVVSSISNALGNSQDPNIVIPLVASVASVVVNALLMPGFTTFFMKIARNEQVEYKELFAHTKLFVPFLLVELLVGIFTALWSLLFIIPGIIAAIAYSMVYYIIIDNPDMDAMAVIKKSKEMMKGHKMDFFVLQLSFIGWGLLTALTCGILGLWLVPYMTVTEINFYDSIKG